MTAEDTRNAILDAAEDLFARSGFEATSLRAITKKADVNLAAVNYHFGTKENLAKAVLSRRFAFVNEERFRRLDALEANGGASRAEDILRAFLEPAMMLGDCGGKVCAMVGRLLGEQPPFLRPYLVSEMRAVMERFVDALARALPKAPRSSLSWRLAFTAGALVHTLLHARVMATMWDQKEVDTMAVLEELVGYALGGLSASSEKTSVPGSEGRR
ncbi:MAG: hypothetical protein Fur0037_21620 [Planctomycetota bacterium]